MKKQLQILSLVSVSLLFIGTIFKMMYWPGVAVIILSGAVIGLLFLLFFINSGIDNINMGIEKNSIVIGSITIMLVLIGFIFKINHWPGAGILVILAHIALFISSIVLFYDAYKETDNSKKSIKLFYSFTIFILIIILLYLAFVTDAFKIA